MEKKLCIFMLFIVMFTLFHQNKSYGMPYETRYIDVKLTKPLVQNNFINLESNEGFVLFEKEYNLLVHIDQTKIKAVIGYNGNIDLLDLYDNVLYTLPMDNSIMISSKDINNSIIKVEKDRYRDYLRLINRNNQIIVLNHVEIENYLYGVVPKEMAYTFPVEALKAQAVAARSFTLSSKKHTSEGYDLCDTIHCQVYSGFDVEHQITNTAVDETRGIFALYEGQPIEALFHSCSSGYTEDSVNAWGGKLPYLKPVEDIFSTESPYSSWVFSIKLSDLSNKLISSSINIGELKGVEILETTSTGNVLKVKLIGINGEEIINGSKLRTILGSTNLKSTWFTVNNENKSISNNEVYVMDGNNVKLINLDEAFILDRSNNEKATRGTVKRVISKDKVEDIVELVPVSTSDLIIEGKGYGHGVGMSQYGAKKMAELGYTFEEILKFYYTGIDVL